MVELFKVDADTARRIPADDLERVTRDLFVAVGHPADDATEIARALVAADLRGVETHGVSNMLRKYLAWTRDGSINPTPQLRIVHQAPATLTYDGDDGNGLAIAPKVMDEVLDRAATYGIAFASVRNSRHLGMLGHHTMRAVDRGMIGVCGTAVGPRLIPTFGREPRLGTNPIAVGVPARTRAPFVFDAAMTAVAQNRLELALRVGRPVPPGLFTDEDGVPYTEERMPEVAMGTRLVPLGGTRQGGSHKGYGLAAVMEILAGVLSGAQIMSLSVAGLGNAHHFFMALDVAAFGDRDQFLDRMDAFLTTLADTPPSPGNDRVSYAGEMEAEALAERSVHGVPLHDEVWGWFAATTADLGVDPGPFVRA
jgi:L-2-hydroxycarboxylate dehydrogenase (NAD+)